MNLNEMKYEEPGYSRTIFAVDLVLHTVFKQCSCESLTFVRNKMTVSNSKSDWVT